MALSLPSLSAAAIDATGRFSTAWVGFFSRLAGPAAAVQPITPGASPFTFTAPADGTLMLSGGTVSEVQFRRAKVTLLALSGPLPMSQGDQAIVTYSATPSMAFVPRGA